MRGSRNFPRALKWRGAGVILFPREGIRVQDLFLRGFSYWRTFDFLGRRPPLLTITLKDLLSKKFPFLGGRGGGSPGSVVNLFQEGLRRGGGEGGLPQVFTCNSYFYCMLLNLSKCNQCNRPMCIIGLSTGWILTCNIINISTTSNNHA